MSGTHIVVCKNEKAIEKLLEEFWVIGAMVVEEDPMEGGDAMVARDCLEQAGFKFGKDFYIRKIQEVLP